MIQAPLDRLWRLSQDPAQHQRWDLRFGRIAVRRRASPDEPQRFDYATWGIAGVGVSTGERWHGDGGATSSLRFASEHPLSPIAEGAGYWRYVPTESGVRFLTGYDYRARRPFVDRLFRPLMGWGTAWSFDRLRLWLETGLTPERAMRRALADAVVRVALIVLAVAWHPAAGLPAAMVALLVPPGPGTPAARRCLRRPPDSVAATAPSDLARLETP